MSLLNPSTEELSTNWFNAIYPYDRASCGFCISQHDTDLTRCKNPKHAPLRKAATSLVKKLGGKMYPKNEKEVEKFIRIRKQFARFFQQGKKNNT
jgi:hypothetical protein